MFYFLKFFDGLKPTVLEEIRYDLKKYIFFLTLKFLF